MANFLDQVGARFCHAELISASGRCLYAGQTGSEILKRVQDDGKGLGQDDGLALLRMAAGK